MTHETPALQEELNSLRQLTMSTMKISSDLGVAVQFLKNSFTVPDYNALACALIETLSGQGLNASVSLETYTGRLFVCYQPNVAATVEAEMRNNLLCGRILENGDTVQINYPSASLIIHNMPKDDDRRGQLRDSLAILLDGVEARVKSLILEEKAEEARQSKEEFFALMSHELRTPLNPIIGYASRLEKKVGDDIPEKHRTALRAIKNNAESLLRLINHIIDLGKLEAGKISLHNQLVVLSETLDRAVMLAEPITIEQNTTIEKHYSNEPRVHADPSRLIDILVSVITYSAKASTDHTISIAVNSIYIDTTPHVDIRITDNGQPVTEAYKTRIFESFASRATSNIYESNDLGIGLYLTKKLVELHSGTIELLTSEKGNTFSICIPIGKVFVAT